MPEPSTIVTFTDTDGDEFPVRIYGHWPARAATTERMALYFLGHYIETGAVRPAEPVKVTKVELLNQRRAEYPSLREDCPETEDDVVESGEADCPVCGLPADDHPAQLQEAR